MKLSFYKSLSLHLFQKPKTMGYIKDVYEQMRKKAVSKIPTLRLGLGCSQRNRRQMDRGDINIFQGFPMLRYMWRHKIIT
jgi:hypothetical protein